jgi:hypothetical protein
MWSRGDVVVARNVWYGLVRTATPGFVVADEPGQLALWVPRGTPFDAPEPRGVPTEWTLGRGQWADDSLVVHHWGEPWIATHVRPPEGSPWWYVDVVDSVRRTEDGVDYRDLLIDVAVEDGIRLLDEDELAEAVELGVLSSDEARAAERVAADVVQLAERGEAPFDGRWDGWGPPAEWGIPSLPG